MDLFGGDSDTTPDGEDINIGAQDVQPAAEAVEFRSRPLPQSAGLCLPMRCPATTQTKATTRASQDPSPPRVYDGDKEAPINVWLSWVRRSGRGAGPDRTAGPLSCMPHRTAASRSCRS
jgi:hypothetical protein